mmetsp:Transcript_34332/g.91806  ORF Transcript_34332/g.91806 Transcript_34332/m.91806 type:complete len:187 (-) Transcript_34332:513-1073(-)
MAGNFFRGTSLDQVKGEDKERRLIRELDKKGRFPSHFGEKVDMSKVSMDVMKPWITSRITELMTFEDDIVVDFCIAQLDSPPEGGLDPKVLQINMTGFMERKAGTFCSELWKHLLSAQESPVGVPREFVERKKEELKEHREKAERIQQELDRRKQELVAAQHPAAPTAQRSRSRSAPRERRRRRFE